MPIFIVDPDGTLLYYNEPAELILGIRFEENGEMPADEWSTIFTPTNQDGSDLPPEELPLMIALTKRCPSHKSFQIRSFDGLVRNIQVTAFPITGQGNRFLGAMAIFWENNQ
ncbi:MAG: hypothetical protein DHS20C17_25670 [Cyclobacteriaceae bacterium]|nr:MAG: hypothetical protein DHS20C17_25670 [Cyclobacteriaceae bacterium]